MNVVFDIGAVLVDFDWDAFVGSMFDAETGLSISAQTSIIRFMALTSTKNI